MQGRHTLLLECVITFLDYIRVTGRAFDSICNHDMVNTMSLLQRITLKFHVKYQILVEPSLIGNGIMWCKERHPLLLECSTTFLRLSRIIGGVPNIIYKPWMVLIMSFLPRAALEFHLKSHISGTLSTRK